MAVFLVWLNLSFLAGKQYENFFYLVAFDLVVSFALVVGVVSNIIFRDRLSSLVKEIDRQRLLINDYAVESALFLAIVEMMEIFGKDISIEETLDRVTQGISNFFSNEIVLVQLFGQHFFQNVKGENIHLSTETFEEIATKPYPILINNLESFPKYRFLKEKNISSFILVPLKSKKDEITGVLGVFSKNNRNFSQKDLSLLRMISIPISLILENMELMEQTKVLSITDPLTHLYNRRHFQQCLEKIWKESMEKNLSFSIAMCDIDNFKFYNDRNGHLAGDRVLRDIAGILHQNIKGLDIVARYGGEEFIMVFPETKKEIALKICDNIRRKVEEVEFTGEEFQPGGDLTISFGISEFPSDGNTADELIRKADMALYEAKKQGRNRVVAA
ncbi:MAG: sensor domain-containing diguanylate cyclase [Candidatus Omnitrophica bacterium]|nr:sensor domain-containing diguanylate cyclase [Candidatus Omnitrophota bacterium]MCM8825317.1 sensor domain-containing diguanylate cyclase [Candidatus Omnitrophota bacterium]